jgi:hypothetical protein
MGKIFSPFKGGAILVLWPEAQIYLGTALHIQQIINLQIIAQKRKTFVSKQKK